MAFHLVTSVEFDFDEFDRRSLADEGPSHVVAKLARTLGARIHQPDGSGLTLADRMWGKIYPEPLHWALAKKVLAAAESGDVIYCLGQDVGIPLAMLKRRNRANVRLAVNSLDPWSGRFQLMAKTFGLFRQIDLFVVHDQAKVDFFQTECGVPVENVLLLPEHTDPQFFRPGPGHQPKNKPIVASAGLEQRDYRTLASAIEGLDVDVRVCAVSPNASKKQAVAMPDVVPKNMEMRYYSFSELRDLYRSADVVVVSLLENKYSAGLTVLMEAIACQRPTVITLNDGLPQIFHDKGLVKGSQPNDVDGMRTAIKWVIENPAEADAMAQKAYAYCQEFHTNDVYVAGLCDALDALGHR